MHEIDKSLDVLTSRLNELVAEARRTRSAVQRMVRRDAIATRRPTTAVEKSSAELVEVVEQALTGFTRQLGYLDRIFQVAQKPRPSRGMKIPRPPLLTETTPSAQAPGSAPRHDSWFPRSSGFP